MKTNQKSKMKLFIVAMVSIKLIISGMYAPSYQRDLVNFVHLLWNGENPYTYYFENAIETEMTYPLVMLLLNSLSVASVNLFQNAPSWMANCLLKLPILLFDGIGLIFLRKIFKQDKNQVTILYFSSPVILYTAYFLGKLDIIAISIVLIAVYYLIQNPRVYASHIAALLSLSMMADSNILVMVPLLLVYLYLKTDGKTLLKSMAVFSTMSFILVLPVASRGYFWLTIGGNLYKNLLYSNIQVGELTINLLLLAVVMIYMKMLSLGSINKNLLFGFATVMSIVFLIGSGPALVGRYVWLIPLIAASNHDETGLHAHYHAGFFYLLNISYIVYAVLLEKDGGGNGLCLAYSLLIGMTLFMAYNTYTAGVRSNQLYKRRGKPITIGITGDSATGKSTMANLLKEKVFTDKVLLLEGDGDHKWERGSKHWEEYTHLNPKANLLYKQALDVAKLREWKTIERVRYDHATGCFTEPEKVVPKKYIVMNGLHTLYLPQMRDKLDFKLYLDAEENLKTLWKIQRDSNERDYTVGSILENIRKRRKDYQKYILPQKQYADMSILYKDRELMETKRYDKSYIPKITLEITFSSEFNVDELMEMLEQHGVTAQHDYSEDLKRQTVVFEYENYKNVEIPFEEIIYQLIPNMDDLWIRKIEPKNTCEGFIQLMFLYIISRTLLK